MLNVNRNNEVLKPGENEYRISREIIRRETKKKRIKIKENE